MSKLFMYGTPLEGIEQLMVMVPNFSPRRSGIVINNYFNCGGGVKDCNCSVINISNRCNAGGCFYFKPRLNTNEKEYIDLIKNCFGKINNNALRIRLKSLSSKFKGEIFLNQRHKERFYNELHKQSIDIYDISPRYIATLFLLTADDMLWKLAEHSVRPNRFDFSQIHLRQISTDGYALYQTAKTISTGKEYIRINEIADVDLIDDTAFKAIIHASLIARYGADVFLITK